MLVEFIPAYDHAAELLPLYEEYAAMLLKTDPIFQVSLDQQNYDVELSHLEEKYGAPRGRIYLIRIDGQVAGTVGMRCRTDTHAELKRLFLRPAFRGHNIGEQAVRRIMSDAKEAGYTHLMLDTLPGLKTAIKLYRRMGFTDRDAYYDCPVPNTIFLEIEL